MGGFLYPLGIAIQFLKQFDPHCHVCLVHGGKGVLHALEEVFLDDLAAAAGANIADMNSGL